MSLERAGRLDTIAADLRDIHNELDVSQTPCNHCGVATRANVTEYYAGQAIESAITKIRKAAKGLRDRAWKDEHE